MQAHVSCPRCHNLLPEGSVANAGTCPQCGSVATPSLAAAGTDAPWWVTPPVAADPPWWVQAPVSQDEPGGAPSPAILPADAVSIVAPPPPKRRRRAALVGGLAAAALLLAGAGFGLLLSRGEPGESPAEPPLARREATPPEARPEVLPFPVADASPVVPVRVSARTQKRPEPIERLPAPAVELAGDAGAAPEPAEEPPLLMVEARPFETPAGVRPLVWLLASASKSRRFQGANLVGRFGSAAHSAAPTLDYTMRADPDTAVANEAAAALARIGRAGVPYLTAALEHKSAAVRQRAAAALALIGPEARTATPALLKALKDKNPRVRAVAAHALADLAGPPNQVVPALCQALRDPAAEVGTQSRMGLVNLGADAVPALRAALKAEDPRTRHDAAEVLGMLGADAKDAAVDLALLLKDGEPQVRAAAAAALSGMGKEAQAAIPALLKAMRREKRFEVQQQLFQALTLVGSRDLPGFLKAVREIDKQGQWVTAYRLGQFGPNPEDAVKPLIKLLADPLPGKRMTAALALGKLGLLSEQSVPALLKAVDDPTPQVRIAASVSLSKLAPGHERLAEMRINSAVKGLNQLLVAQAQQRLTLVAQNGLAAALRPLNRQALMDPAFQSQYDQLLSTYLLIAIPDCRVHGLMVTDTEMYPLVQRLVSDLPMEAVPALVRAINQAAIMNLGFC